MTQPTTYTYAQVAARIEQELGTRPSMSSLRAATATTARGQTPRPGRARLTVGMPTKLPGRIGGRTVFDAAAIDAWLATHPLKAWRHAATSLATSLRAHEPLEQCIAQARAAGMSWADIAHVWGDVEGRTRTATGVHRRFRHVDEATPVDE